MGPPFSIAKLVNIIPISLGFMVDIPNYLMGVIKQRSHQWGAPPCNDLFMGISTCGEQFMDRYWEDSGISCEYFHSYPEIFMNIQYMKSTSTNIDPGKPAAEVSQK